MLYVILNLVKTSCQQKLQQLLLKIPKGKMTTYKAIASAMGTRGYRFVGHLLHQNPYPDKYPCYKVVQSDGRIGGFVKGPKEKIKRLNKDCIQVKNDKIVNFQNILFKKFEQD